MKNAERSGNQDQTNPNATKWKKMASEMIDGADGIKQQIDMTPEDHKRVEEGVQRRDDYEKYLKQQLHEIYSRDINYQLEHSDKISELQEELNRIDPLKKTESYANTNTDTEADRIARQKEHEEYLEKQKDLDTKERFGSNEISAREASRAFFLERAFLQKKKRRAERADEREKNMDKKALEKSRKQREKNDEYFNVEEEKHLRELDSIVNIRQTEGAEDYGRRKEQKFREIQETIEQNKRGFKKWAKSNNISLPKTWDDPEYSLDDLARININSKFLRNE